MILSLDVNVARVQAKVTVLALLICQLSCLTVHCLTCLKNVLPYTKA